MQDKTTKEQWIRLCEQAAVEQDHEKLLKLVSEITRMLDEKDQRLKQRSNPESPMPTGNSHSEVERDLA